MNKSQVLGYRCSILWNREQVVDGTRPHRYPKGEPDSPDKGLQVGKESRDPKEPREKFSLPTVNCVYRMAWSHVTDLSVTINVLEKPRNDLTQFYDVTSSLFSGRNRLTWLPVCFSEEDFQVNFLLMFGICFRNTVCHLITKPDWQTIRSLNVCVWVCVSPYIMLHKIFPSSAELWDVAFPFTVS